jgi:hypothetical protein
MRRIVMMLLGLGVAAACAGAGALFTDRAEVPDNYIKAGAVSVSGEPTSAALSISSLAPGTTATKQLTVVNDGSLPMKVVVTAVKKAGISDFYDALQCRVVDDGTLLYEGALSAMRTSADQMAAGERRTLDVAVSLPESAGNDLSGDYAKVSLYLDAEQVR